MQPSESDLLNRYRKKGAISSRMSVIIKGGKESNSHDFKFTEEKIERRSDSTIGWKPSKTDVVEENVGGGASVVDARRRSVFAVSMSRKSLAEKAGISEGRDGRPRSPEMEDQRRFGFLAFRATSCSQYAASFWW